MAKDDSSPRVSDTTGRITVHSLVPLFLWGVGLILFFRFFPAFKLILLGLLDHLLIRPERVAL